MLRKTALALLFVIAAPWPARGQALTDHPRIAEALNLLEIWLEAQRDYEDVPGLSLAVVHDQDMVWSGAYGYADRERVVPATTKTIYSICSISKLFTSIAVMQLRDQGKLRLDDPVEEHLSWFDIERAYPDAPAVTVQSLLTHSSGLPRESDYPYWTGPEFAFPNRDQIIERLADQETLYPASKYFQYSNLGLTLAGEIVAAASGMPFDVYVRRNILDPLGLDDTSPEIPLDQKGQRMATGYGAAGREGIREPLTILQVRGIAPAAGFASTVEDLASFAAWQFRLLETGGSEILSANTLREMHRVHWVDPDWTTHWGLGFAVWRDDDKTFVGHGGSCPGYRSQLMLQTDEKLATVVMTNAMGVNARKYARIAYQIVSPAMEQPLDSTSAVEATDLDLGAYAGTYGTAWGGELAVFAWKDGLAMLHLPTDDPMDSITRLNHAGGNTFRRVRSDDSLGEEIVFEMEDDRAVRFKRHSNYYPRIK
ncbi:MAG: serine hydrolase [Gemmatimonadales bacterium]|jgi:CubicO group peptidase (beta-lactamase class C family)